MTKLPLIAATLIVASAGLAAPSFASTGSAAANTAPFCHSGIDNLDVQKTMLASDLKHSGGPSGDITDWNGCLKVTSVQDGKTIMYFYEPGSLKLVATVD